MKNNDIIRRIRYTFNLDDSTMMKLSSSAEKSITRTEISNWMKREDDIGFEEMKDNELAIFLNHFIEKRRGKRDGPAPAAEKRLTNNLIFMKLKIALNLKAEEVLEILKLSGFNLGKHELSAFFRKPGHKHFRECKDQVLRNFLQGMQDKYRVASKTDTLKVEAVPDAPAPPAGGYAWKKKPGPDA